MSQLPKELCFKVMEHLDAEILLDLLKDVHFRDQFWQYFEIVTDDDEPLQYWNYDFKRSKIDDTEVSGLKIFLMEIHDFQKIDVDSLTNKFKGATSLVAVDSQAGGDYEIPYGICPDTIDPSTLAKFITENPNLTVVACLDDDWGFEEAFDYLEVNLEKLRFLKFKTLIFGECCTLHGVLKPKRLENLYIGAIADVPFDLLKTVHPNTLKELSLLSLNIKGGLELQRFKFDSLKEAVLLGLVSLRDIQFPLLITMELEGKKECELSGKLVNITAPNLLTIRLYPGGTNIQYELLDAPNLKCLISYGSNGCIYKDDDIYDERFLFEEIHETEYTGPILEKEWFSQVEFLSSHGRTNDVLRSSKLRDNLKRLLLTLHTNQEVKRLNYIGELSQLEVLEITTSAPDTYPDLARHHTAVEIPKLKAPHLKELIIFVHKGGIKTDVIVENYSTIEDLSIQNEAWSPIPLLPSVSTLELPFLRKMDLSRCYGSLTEDQIGWQVPNLEELNIRFFPSSVDCIIDIPSASKLRKLICGTWARERDNVLIIRNESIETIECDRFAYLTLDGNVGPNVKSIEVRNWSRAPFRRLRAKELPVIEVLVYASEKGLNGPSIIEEVGYMNPECVRELKDI